MEFKGYTETTLMQTGNQWIVEINGNPDVYATIDSEDYPFGTQRWTVTGPDPCGNGSRLLNINACSDSEFNCDDGSCIPIEMRCNGLLDCPDKSGYAVINIHRASLIQ